MALSGVSAVFSHNEAGVRRQVFQPLRLAMGLQVRRRGHQHALVGCKLAHDPLGGHAGRWIPQPDGRVKAHAGQVGQLLGQLKFDLHAWAQALEVTQGGADPQAAKAKAADQADWPRGLALLFAQFVFGGSKILQDLPRPLAQGMTFGGRADAACGALEQAHAQPGFERGQALGRHGWGQAQSLGRFGQAALGLHGQNEFEVAAFHCF